MRQTTLFNYQIQKIESKPKCDNSNNNNLQEFKLKEIIYKPSSVDSDVIEGFDKSKTDWIYPINYPIRDYQLQIVQECLFKNTLVCLPTGLGKTFIASVVMFNFYRWYPSGKIIFVAPTRPLVNQQMYACQETVPIDLSDVVEMTGSISQNLRTNLWKEKRVFFLTAQVLVNDLISKICPGKSIVFLVLDEAHKASKNHAYCQVIRELTGENHQNRIFRVLGLSATPGNDIITIQDVIQNLLISHIELRTDECKDIQKYSHERLVEEIIVPLGSEVIDVRDRLLGICSPIIERLKVSGAITTPRSINTLTKFGLLKMKDEYRMRTGGFKSYSILTDFSQAISLYYAIELVQQHGLKPTLLYLSNAISNSQANPQILDLLINKEFMKFYEMLQQRMNSESFISSHPKLEKLQDIVKAHFSNKTESEQKNSRVIIFSQIRDSVDEIMVLLKKLEPLIRPIAFMGQTKHVSQREQMEAMRLFTEGAANVLVSTCIGEEGLDIGEVDLIICFDSQKSPIRLVQRAGRTGRKKEGRVVMLLSEGKEVNNYRTSLSKKSRIHSAIFEGYKHLVFYPDNPRMVPLGIEPTISYQKVTVSKKIKNIPMKKIRKSSKQQALTDCMSNANKTITLNTDLNVCDSMRFLNESPVSELKTFTTTYHSNNYKKSFYHTQPTINIGHSDLTRNLISVLKLKEMHNRGKTNILFHLSNSRILNIDEPMTESDEEIIDQHDSDSFSISLSSEIDDFNDDFKKNFQDCLQKLNNHVVISSSSQPLRPNLSNKLFNNLLDNVESTKPNLLSQIDKIIEIIQQTDFKSKSIKNTDQISILDENNYKFAPQTSSIINLISPVKYSSFNSKPMNSLCTSTPIVPNVRSSNIKSILTSFNIQKTPQKSLLHQSILNSFKIPLNNNSINKNCTSILNQCSTVSNKDTHLGMKVALQYFKESSVLSCELSSDLFDLEEFNENTSNNTKSLSILNDTSNQLQTNKSQLIKNNITKSFSIIDHRSDQLQTNKSRINNRFKLPNEPSDSNPVLDSEIKTNKSFGSDEDLFDLEEFNESTSNITKSLSIIDHRSNQLQANKSLIINRFELSNEPSGNNPVLDSEIRIIKSFGSDEDLFDLEEFNESTSNITKSLSIIDHTSDQLQTRKSQLIKNNITKSFSIIDHRSDQLQTNKSPIINRFELSDEPSDSNPVLDSEIKRFQSDEDLFSDDFDSYSPLSETENHSPESIMNLCVTENENIKINDTSEVKSFDEINSDISDSFLKARSRSPSFDSNYEIDSYFVEDNLSEYKNKSNTPSFESDSIQKNVSLNNQKINSSSPSFDGSFSFYSDKDEDKSLIQPKKNPAKEFFFSQAFVSPKNKKRFEGDEEEEDDDNNHYMNEQYESSFIDNENSFATNTQMQQVYLQSIKSPNLRKNPLKNVNPAVVYSQTFSSDDDYMMDSFVIPDDYKTPKKKRRLKQSNDVSVKKYKRLQSINDSMN